MNKIVRVILIDDAKIFYEKCNNIQLFNSANSKIEFIKLNPFYGDNIQKKIIPKSLNVNNLWRVELAQFYRLLYTIKGDENEIICFVIKILNHDEYNKLFGYRKF